MKKLIIYPTLLTVGVIGGFVLFSSLPAPTAPETCFKDQTSVGEIIKETNKARADKGLAPLTENGQLTNAAVLKEYDMLTSHYWAHVSPSGTQPWYWFTQVGYPYKYAGENLAEDYQSAEQAMSGWMNSPGHRDNILNPHYTEIGVAVVCGKTNKETTLVVAEYGSK